MRFLDFASATPEEIISKDVETKVDGQNGQEIALQIRLIEAVFVQDILASMETRQVLALLEAG